MKEVYIICAKRTAIGNFLGSLSNIEAHILGGELIKAIIEETKLEARLINEVILGQVITGGCGQNPARQSSIYAKLPYSVPAMTINKVCGSGLKSVSLASNAIALGQADLVIAGGQENMSLGMHGAYLRSGNKAGEIKFIDMMMHDGLTDAFSKYAMGITAENIASRFTITREEQDKLALNSQIKSAKAQKNGKFKDEIVPIKIKTKKENIIFDQDEGIRENTNLESLAKLRTVFKDVGTVTAGNSSTINDGAACILLASKEAVKKYNLNPIARVASFGISGVDPSIMGTGPVNASKNALDKANWKVSGLDLIESNEAFAVQAEYVNRMMKWDTNKVNVNGGAIALGHPIGASGARILVTLLHEMKRSKAKKSLATLCIGGGMGIATCLEKC